MSHNQDMTPRFTRRELAAVFAAPAVQPERKAQPGDEEQVAKRNLARDLETLRDFAVPMSTEPAFRFEA
jgi:hypothetical protein